jgi:hypothetical protein
MTVLVLISLSVGTFTVLTLTTNPVGQHRVPSTPGNVRSYEAAVCDAAIRGDPRPSSPSPS